VVEDEFFKKRTIPKPGRASYSSETIEVGTAFQDMVFEAARPILEKHAKTWVVENTDLIADYWKKVTDAGLMRYVEALNGQMATQALKDQMNLWLQNMNQQRQNQGLPRIPTPYFV
jgi:hypothetical protein